MSGVDRLVPAGIENDTSASQSFVPSHTPQLSNDPSQHSPDGASAREQHTPDTSITTPSPPHTPHASTCTPAVQHRPSPSTAPPAPQHAPVTLSMAPSQHVPFTSTTAVADTQFVPTGCSSTTPHLLPLQPTSHTHTPLPPHTKCAPMDAQSAPLLQTHGPALQSCVRAGVVDSGVAHAPSATTPPLPLANTHSTLRVCMPLPHRSAVDDVLLCMQRPHSPTRHATAAAGQGNRLHAADVGGGAKPASTHCWDATVADTPVTTSVLTHDGGVDVVSPSTSGSVVAVSLPAPRLSHGAEQALQLLDGTHVSVGHGCVLHAC